MGEGYTTRAGFRLQGILPGSDDEFLCLAGGIIVFCLSLFVSPGGGHLQLIPFARNAFPVKTYQVGPVSFVARPEIGPLTLFPQREHGNGKSRPADHVAIVWSCLCDRSLNSGNDYAELHRSTVDCRIAPVWCR